MTTKKPARNLFEERLRALHTAIGVARDDSRRAADAEYDAAALAAGTAHSEITSSEEQARGISDHVQSVLNQQALAAQLRITDLAPGLASMAVDDLAWRSPDFYGGQTPSHVRIGRLDVPGADVPAVVPLLGTAGWSVTGDRARAQSLMTSTMLRMLASADPYRVRVDTYDPLISGAVGLLGSLTSRAPAIVPKAVHDGAGLNAVLDDLVELSAARAALLNQFGYDRFEQLTESSRAREAYRVLMLLDYPNGFNEEMQANLLRLAATGHERGICLMVHYDPTIQPARDVDPGALVNPLAALKVSEQSVTASALPGVPIRLDGRFPTNTVSTACALVADRADNAVLPTIPLTDLLPLESQQWLPVQDELEALIGFTSQSPVNIKLRSGNPAFPHMLIGGSAGQGKSNLLMVLIHSLAARYAPSDLEMYLLDFKYGVEMAPLGPTQGREHFLPHVKVLGVHSNRTFGLAVLKHLSDELARRSEAFKAAGVSDIADLPPGESRPPRLLVVLDEFQVLLDGDDDVAEESVLAIEKLSRLGRAYGVHLVLATQTIEGMARLAQRRDSIFGQVPHRIALKTTPSDSQALLGTGNKAAAELQFRGEAIVNTNYGNIDDNQRVLVGYAEPAAADALRRELWLRASSLGEVQPPRVFDIDSPAILAEALGKHEQKTDQHGSPLAWIGQPITIAEEPAAIPLRHETGAGLLVLGDGPETAVGVLSSVALTAAMADPDDVRPQFLILDPTGSDKTTREHKEALVDSLLNLGCRVEVMVEIDEIVTHLVDLRDQIKEHPVAADGTPRTYLICIGFHAMPRMKAYSQGQFESPADVLTEIVREGPTAGVLTIGWWNRLSVATDHLGFSRADIATHLFLKHPRDGIRSVCGPFVKWKSENNRALLWDGIQPEPLELVPFSPLQPADVPALTQGCNR